MFIKGRSGKPWEESSLEKFSLSFPSLTQGALQRLQRGCVEASTAAWDRSNAEFWARVRSEAASVQWMEDSSSVSCSCLSRYNMNGSSVLCTDRIAGSARRSGGVRGSPEA